MSNKNYYVILDDQIIGETRLEKADASMGVVFGLICFRNIESGYSFFKKYCTDNNVQATFDSPSERMISTRIIPSLHVYDAFGKELKGYAHISGDDFVDGFDIIFEGLAYPFYEEEFPHHVKAYKEMFS